MSTYYKDIQIVKLAILFYIVRPYVYIRLDQQFAFIREIDREKFIGRQTYLSDGRRKENDAVPRATAGTD